jgi:cell division protein FtsQ
VSESSGLRPGAERRRLRRQQRRQERLVHLWRLLVFSALATGLGYGLLRQGWMLRSPAQVEVIGSRVINRDQVIQAAGLRFPEHLLSLHPRDLAHTLTGKLPVENVRVSRLMLPPRIRVELRDRTAVARAERSGPGGMEQGFVDRQGQWISVNPNLGLAVSEPLTLRVLGWNERHSAALGQVLTQRQQFGGRLRLVRFDPAGNIWLETAELGALRLGPADAQLPQRLTVAAHLSATLPAQLQGKRPQMVDLSDPNQPEITLPGLRSQDLPSPSSATRPRGGQ